MIEVRIRIGNGVYTVEAEGHALFGKNGNDIVCAAVSVLLQNWLLSERELCEAAVSGTQKNGEFRAVLNGPGEREKLLLESLILGMTVLKNQHPERIKVKVEENHGKRQYSEKRKR